MEVALTTYYDQEADKTWSRNKAKLPNDAKFLALAAQVEDFKKALNNNADKPGTGVRKCTVWRYKNPDNQRVLEQNGKTYKWCDKDCHPCEQWCECKNCRHCADYKNSVEEKKKEDEKRGITSNKNKQLFSNKFKVALAAITSANDYQALETQFFQGGESEETIETISKIGFYTYFLSPLFYVSSRIIGFVSITFLGCLILLPLICTY